MNKQRKEPSMLPLKKNTITQKKIALRTFEDLQKSESTQSNQTEYVHRMLKKPSFRIETTWMTAKKHKHTYCAHILS